MIGKVLNLAGMIALATVLGGGGFVGYLFGTGQLDGQRLEAIAGVLRGESEEEEPAEAAAAEPEQVEQSEEGEPDEMGARPAEQARKLHEQEHLESLRLERAARDLEAQRRLLDQTMQEVVQEQEQLEADQARFAKRKAAAETEALDEGFRKELALVSGLQPRLAKEHIVNVWKREQADAVRLFGELDEGRARRILEQFKTPEELQIMTDLLEQIRLQGTSDYAAASGKTAGKSSP